MPDLATLTRSKFNIARTQDWKDTGRFLEDLSNQKILIN